MRFRPEQKKSPIGSVIWGTLALAIYGAWPKFAPQSKKSSPSETPSMKLLRHLLIGAVGVVVLTTTTISAQPADENVSKLLRGPEEIYDKADLFPAPEDNFSNAEPSENDDEGVLPPGAGDEDETEPGEEHKDQLIPAESEESDGDLPPDTTSEDELVLTEETGDELIDIEDVGEVDLVDHDLYVRHLRSSFDPALHGQIQVDEPEPITEFITPPSSVTNGKLVGFPDQRDSNPNFRGLDVEEN